MSPRKSQMNRKHWYPNQKGKNYTNIKQTARKKSPPHNKKNTTNINSYKQTKYQPTKEVEPIKCKTTNKFQTEHAQAGIPKPKTKNKVRINILSKKHKKAS